MSFVIFKKKKNNFLANNISIFKREDILFSVLKYVNWDIYIIFWFIFHVNTYITKEMHKSLRNNDRLIGYNKNIFNSTENILKDSITIQTPWRISMKTKYVCDSIAFNVLW